jgi:conjugative transfer region protein TrbK
MIALINIKRLSAVAVGAVMLVVAACAIQLRGGEDTSPASTAPRTTDTIDSSLARCRTVTSEQTATYEYCRGVWAENRRRFFGQKESTATAARRDPSTSPAPVLAPKDQSQMPQGYPSIPAPDGSNP